MKPTNTPSNPEIPTSQWIDLRQQYLGGSDCAAILGKSSFKTPLHVWMEKQGLIDPPESTPIMDFGNIFEPVMADAFEQITGLKVRRVNKTIEHSEYDFLRANIDRQILNSPENPHDGTGILELKTTTSHRLKSLDGEFPIEWLYQIQSYLGITGYSYAYLFIYERDMCQYYEPILIQRDDEFIEQLFEDLVEWWEKFMIGGKRPDPINGEDALLLYPESGSHLTSEASPKDYELYQELKSIRQRKTDLEKMEESLATKLKCSMEEAERLVLSGRTLISWKTVESKRFDSTTFREEHPELYRNFRKTTQTRPFKVY